MTAPYIPQQNRVSERKNRTIVEKDRSLLKKKELPNDLRTEVVATTIYSLTQSPNKAIQNMTPFEAWKCMKPSVNHLKIFGCITYSISNSHYRQKLDNQLENTYSLDILMNQRHTNYTIH